MHSWARRSIAIAAFLFFTGAASSSAAPLLDEERRRLLAHLDMTANWLIDEVSALSSAQLHFQRAPDTWTILQVLEHLIVVGPIYWEDLQRALKSPPRERAGSSTDADMLWYGIDRTPIVREKAIPAEQPKGLLRDAQAGLTAYRKAHARLVEYIQTTKDDLRSHHVDRQGCDAYQWALLISTHEQRHILQIREIKADAKFPKR